MARILLVDDERDLIWALRQNLLDDGYEVLVAYDGLEALNVAHRHRPDAIVLDVVMPHLDGVQVCHKLRRDPTLASVPVLFMTVRSAIEDRIAGLDEGGDDYLAKPCDLRELKAHLRALLRRSRSAPRAGADYDDQGSLRVGSLRLDLGMHQVCLQDKRIQLTPIEFDVLVYLMTHADEVFSSEHLLQNVWGYPPRTADPGLVRWHIKNLRTKIETNPLDPVYVCTVPRHGYAFRAPSSGAHTQA